MIVGEFDGADEGGLLGVSLGLLDGEFDGDDEGGLLGDSLGLALGEAVGPDVGLVLGEELAVGTGSQISPMLTLSPQGTLKRHPQFLPGARVHLRAHANHHR